MMILRLIPNVVTHLPLTSYYSITFLSLYVGKSGIRRCTLKIGDRAIEFKQTDKTDENVLAVDGDPENTPTHVLLRENEQIKLEVPETGKHLAGEEIHLRHFLFYSVPRQHKAG